MKIGSQTLIEGDAAEELDKLDDESMDLILTDPPYGVGYRSNRRVIREKFDKMEGDADLSSILDCLPNLHRVLKPDRHIYVFCNWRRYHILKPAMDQWFNVKNCIVWVKNNHGAGDLQGSYAPKHEFIIFAHKGRRHIKHRYEDIQEFDKVHSSRLLHPTQKPVGLTKRLIENSSDEGEVVLDPFAGSATTLVGCEETDRRGIGIEINPEYVMVGEQRIREECNVST